MNNQLLKNCVVCGSKNLKQLLNLPSLPLTGLYFPSSELALQCNSYDQALNKCQECGHAQLKTAIDPQKVYDTTYTHRSSGSPISSAGNDFLFEYATKRFSIDSDTKLLEIGCNDGYLLKKLSQKTSQAYGIDPIWIDKEPPKPKSFKIFGGYANQISQVLPKEYRPNFVISAHTFEHTISLYEDLKCIVNFAEEGSIFVIEMPSFDTLIRLRRFDQVFHQHIQYISESSISALVNRLNCNLLDIHYNYKYWGGTVIFSFKKTSESDYQKTKITKIIQEKIDQSLKDFVSYKNILGRQLSFHPEIYYLGAAQMLPILNYHLNPQINNLVGILDDNELRIGKFLPTLDIKIDQLSSIDIKKLENSGNVIGAVDSGKSLIKRARDIGIPNIYSFYQNII